MNDNRYQIRSIPVEFNGIKYKSTLEARLAILYDALDIDAEYEPITFNLSVIPGLTEEIERKRYTPDYLINDRGQHILIEAKGPEPSVEEEVIAYAITNWYSFPVYFQRYMFDPRIRLFRRNAEYLEGMMHSRSAPTVRWIECRYCNRLSRGIGAMKGTRNNRELVWKCVWCGKADPETDRTPRLLAAYDRAKNYDFHGTKKRKVV